jgi:hypothetical protein
VPWWPGADRVEVEPGRLDAGLAGFGLVVGDRLEARHGQLLSAVRTAKLAPWRTATSARTRGITASLPSGR